MDDTQLLRYSRHLLLNEFGVDAQERLLSAHVLVIGAGGLGSSALLYLASAGIGQLTIADGDTVDLTNLQRQIVHSTDTVGQPKAQSAQQRLLAINPTINITALTQRLAGDALQRAVAAADCVLDCSDNFATRYAINAACVAAAKPLVSGAGIRFDGQLAVFDTRRAESPCYHCLFPQSPDAVENEADRCGVMGVFAPLVGVIGTLQAAEAIKLLSGVAGGSTVGQLLLYEALAGRFHRMHIARDPDCVVCKSRPNLAKY